MIYYILISYFIFSIIFYFYLHRKFYFKEKQLNEKINELSKSLKQKDSSIKQKENIDKIVNPDKNKPFAKISSASTIETIEFEQKTKSKRKCNEKISSSSDIEQKSKRKYTKKVK